MDFTFTSLGTAPNEFFYEGPKPRARVGVDTTLQNTSSIDVSGSDPWVQGVEMTSQRQYDAGIVKIWSGEPYHFHRQNAFGESVSHHLNEPFVDADSIGDVNVGAFLYDYDTTLFDGVLEPLRIRMHTNYEVFNGDHAVIGSFIGDAHGASIVNVYEHSQSLNVPFVEGGPIVKIPHVNTSPTPAADYVKKRPFVDVGAQRDDDPLTYGMDPPHDSYVPAPYVAACAGFVYDSSNNVNTDSIAFGGLSH